MLSKAVCYDQLILLDTFEEVPIGMDEWGTVLRKNVMSFPDSDVCDHLVCTTTWRHDTANVQKSLTLLLLKHGNVG